MRTDPKLHRVGALQLLNLNPIALIPNPSTAKACADLTISLQRTGCEKHSSALPKGDIQLVLSDLNNNKGVVEGPRHESGVLCTASKVVPTVVVGCCSRGGGPWQVSVTKPAYVHADPPNV